MIGCSAWPGVKIGDDTKVGGIVGCITGVVRTDWFAWGGMIATEGGLDKDINREPSFTIILRWRSQISKLQTD